MKYVLTLIAAMVLSACTMTQVRTIVTSDQMPTTSDSVAKKEPLAVPAVTQPATLPDPVEELVNTSELECLALNMYHEARGEGSRGMLAVGYVTVNRTQTQGFPKTICGVVHEGVYRNGKIVYRRCQFSWYCDGRSDKATNLAQYEQAHNLARAILTGQASNPVGKSVFFHNGQVKPRWRRVVFQCRIGGHRFYRKA